MSVADIDKYIIACIYMLTNGGAWSSRTNGRHLALAPVSLQDIC